MDFAGFLSTETKLCVVRDYASSFESSLIYTSDHDYDQLYATAIMHCSVCNTLRPGTRQFAFHCSCLYLTSLKNAVDIAHLFGLVHEPSVVEHQQRITWARYRCARALSSSYQHTRPALSFDLWYQIGEHLLRECITSNVIASWQPLRHLQSAQVCQPMRLEFTYFEGQRYIGSLRNLESFESNGGLIDTKIDVLYVAQNCGGITQILHMDSMNTPAIESEEGTWWKVIPVTGRSVIYGMSDVSQLPRMLLVRSDDAQGFTLRDVSTSATTTSCSREIVWSSPPNLQKLQIEQMRSRASLRMVEVLCQRPNVIGLSARWDQRLRGIYAEKQLKRDKRTHDGRTNWLFMPLDEGEMVAEVWYRRGCSPRDYGLLVSSWRAPAVQRTDSH